MERSDSSHSRPGGAEETAEGRHLAIITGALASSSAPIRFRDITIRVPRKDR